MYFYIQIHPKVLINSEQYRYSSGFHFFFNPVNEFLCSKKKRVFRVFWAS
ncbi:hypothetical protein [Citrobacter freundii]|uniref:Uncharacterized protein n=1 Tax=Citrobacter freundii TaxID=546 RepID=A0A7G2IP26_CITFR|nr:hypothetical protein [Citrobacter freundii]